MQHDTVTLRERLARLESVASEGLREQREYAAVAKAFQEEMRQVMHGRDGGPGLVMRIDRIEQVEARRARYLWLAISTSVAALVTAIVKHINGAK